MTKLSNELMIVAIGQHGGGSGQIKIKPVTTESNTLNDGNDAVEETYL